jgi:hypothetical protein
MPSATGDSQSRRPGLASFATDRRFLAWTGEGTPVIRDTAVGTSLIARPRQDLDGEPPLRLAVGATVGAALRMQLPIASPPSLLHVTAVGPGWVRLTDRADLALVGSPTVTVGSRQRVRLPRGLVRELWREAAHGHDQALIVVQRHVTVHGKTYVDVLSTGLLPTLLNGVVLPEHAADWPFSR